MTPALRSIVALIVRCCDPEEIVLFGSHAKGRTHDASDVDLLVIGDFRRSRYLRAQEVEELLLQFPMPIDVHLLTRAELEAESADPLAFYRTIRIHGVTLYRREPDGAAPVRKKTREAGRGFF
jgi:uncharacterized protein